MYSPVFIKEKPKVKEIQWRFLQIGIWAILSERFWFLPHILVRNVKEFIRLRNAAWRNIFQGAIKYCSDCHRANGQMWRIYIAIFTFFENRGNNSRFTVVSYSNERFSFKWELPFMPLSFHQKRGAIERGWGQVGSSHLNEKFSFE